MTEKNKGKKLLTWTLALSMTLALPPVGVFAEENAEGENGVSQQTDGGFVTLPAMGQPVGLPAGDGADAPKAVVVGNVVGEDRKDDPPDRSKDENTKKGDADEGKKDIPLPSTDDAFDGKAEETTPGVGDGKAEGGGGGIATLEGEGEDSTPIATPAEEAKDVAAIGETKYDTLQGAIKNAKDGDTIKLLKDVTENITIDKSITLDLNKKTLSGDGTDTVVKISVQKDAAVTVQNGTVTGGNTTSNGGGFDIQSGTVTIEKCTIEGNKAKSGGGFYIAGCAKVKLVKCTIADNEVSSSGGAIHLTTLQLSNDENYDSTCEIEDTTLANNQAYYGGAIALSGSDFASNIVNTETREKGITAKVTISGNSLIQGNKARNYGGGIYLTGNGSRFHMINGTISGNTSYQGGGIWSRNYGGIEIDNGIICSNETKTCGGAIYIKSGISDVMAGAELAVKTNLRDKLYLGKATVTDNHATQGGGIFIDVGITEIDESDVELFGVEAKLASASIYNNHAEDRGAKKDILPIGPIGDDIYCHSTGTKGWVQLGDTTKDWELDCADKDGNKDKVDGWYLDGKEDGENILRWNAHPMNGTVYTEKFTGYEDSEKLTGTLALKAAHERLYLLTIHYQYENGDKAADTYTSEYSKNTAYKVESPSISQYKADQSVVEGEIGTEDVEVTVIYRKESSGGGGGGGHHPKPKPTVDIPDDDALGLNDTDHFAYIVGYGHGDVQPQNSITRAEVAAIFFRLLEDGIRSENFTHQNDFSDVAADAWYCSSVSTLSRMGIIAGYPDGTFRPNAPITRAEFAAIATRFDNNGDKTPVNFNDIIGHWAEDEITVAANHGWVSGYGDGTFRPESRITRAETMSLVNRVLKRLPETPADLLPDMITWTDNADTSSWYYLPVQEATNSHYYEFKENSKYEKWTELRETRDWSKLG